MPVSVPSSAPSVPRPVRGAVVVLAAAVALTACAGEDGTDGAATPEDTTTTIDQSGDDTVAPDLPTEAPDALVVEQLAPPPDPDAPEAKPGDVVAVDYVGRSLSTGEVFDSSEGRGPFQFQLGVGMVIAGWDQGIAGLQVGERARLIIPPDLAYGEAGAGGVIGPNETLVFDVQLVEIVSAADSTETPTS
jgi:peptidylprolyl isomerase